MWQQQWNQVPPGNTQQTHYQQQMHQWYMMQQQSGSGEGKPQAGYSADSSWPQGSETVNPAPPAHPPSLEEEKPPLPPDPPPPEEPRQEVHKLIELKMLLYN